MQTGLPSFFSRSPELDKFTTTMLIPTALVLILTVHLATTARILVIPAHSAASHTKSMYPISERLSTNGHEVVMLQIIQYKESKAKAPPKSKIQDIYLWVPLGQDDPPEPFSIPSYILWGKPILGGIQLVFPWHMCTSLCKKILDNENTKKQFDALIKEHWDLVFVDDLFTPCGMLAAMEAKRLSNTSIINFGTSILIPQSQEARGLRLNYGILPGALPTDGVYDHTNFMHRLLNTVDFVMFSWVELALDYLVPYWLRLPQSPSTVSSLFALHSDLSMASLSPSLEFTKPMVNDIIELDVNCPSKSKLPESYQKFVEDPASKGTIIFAMGHAADWDTAPDGVVEAFMEVFETLSEYRIVWQFVTRKPEKPKASPHLLLDNWVPQSALLYHPKTRLFISHVGGKSLREAICAGVPVVAMPMFAEQYRNTAIAMKKNIAKFLDKTKISTTLIYDAITGIINDTIYSSNVRRLRDQLADRVMEPMEVGRFWSEFLIRQKTSGRIEKYMRIRWSKLTFFASSNVDVASLGLLTTFIFMVVVK